MRPWLTQFSPHRGSDLRVGKFATKLTPTGTALPSQQCTGDEYAIWLLAHDRLIVGVEEGEIYRPNWKRAEIPRKDGYGAVYLGRINGKIKWGRAHRIVWIAEHGPIPGTYQINHLNGHRWDNRIANLDLCTPGENARHAHKLEYSHIPGVKDSPDDRPTNSPVISSSFVRPAGHGRRRAADGGL